MCLGSDTTLFQPLTQASLRGSKQTVKGHKLFHTGDLGKHSVSPLREPLGIEVHTPQGWHSEVEYCLRGGSTDDH